MCDEEGRRKKEEKKRGKKKIESNPSFSLMLISGIYFVLEALSPFFGYHDRIFN